MNATRDFKEIQVSVRKPLWRDFPIDPLATMALRLAQMRRALDLSFRRRVKSASEIDQVRHQVNAMKQLVQAAETAPLLLVLLVILDRIDGALESGKVEFAHRAIIHLESALLAVS